MKTNMTKYRPSNGNEGLAFYDFYCLKCKKLKNDYCKIFADTMTYDIDDVNYPQEWMYIDNIPTCTLFKLKEKIKKKVYKESVVDKRDQLSLV